MYKAYRKKSQFRKKILKLAIKRSECYIFDKNICAPKFVYFGFQLDERRKDLVMISLRSKKSFVNSYQKKSLPC